MFKVVAFSYFLIFGLSSLAFENPSKTTSFHVNTYANTCFEPNPLTHCLLQKTRTALSLSELGPYTSSAKDLNDSRKLAIDFFGSDEIFYKLELLSLEQSGWTEGYEAISDNGCSLNFPDKEVHQIFHTTSQLDFKAKIYRKVYSPIRYEFVADIDISSCP